MYCSSCGEKADGRFCSACGSLLQASAGPKENQPETQQAAQTVFDWTNEVVYERLLESSEVRERIAAAAKRSPKTMTGEEMLALFDSIVPTGVKLEKLTVALLPVLDRIGIKTGKSSSITLTAPAGPGIVATLCALASQGYELQKVDQAPDGCVLRAMVPSSLWTNRGELVVSLERRDRTLTIEAATKISGQVVDWGRSNKILNDLFDAIRHELTELRSRHGGTKRSVA